MAFAIAATAQTKRIAILETIDKEGNVPYAVEVMVRSNLTKVISSTPGYEGYDRVNISQIMDEHDFERTGMVNEEQIRRLGELSGADFILVSEAVKFEESNIYVTAKILNVETAKMEASENELMGIGAQDIQHGCKSLANRLLGLPDPVSETTVHVISEQTESLEAESLPEKEKTEAVVPQNIVNNNTIDNNNLIVKQGKTYFLNGQSFSKDEYVNLIQNLCPQAYESYKKGATMQTVGWCMLGAGVAVSMLFPFRSSSVSINGSTTTTTTSMIGVILGGSLTLASIPTLIIGGNRKNNSYKIYNQNCTNRNGASLGFYPTINGVGVYLSF